MDTNNIRVQVMGSTAYVITDVDYKALKEVLSVGEIRATDEEGNHILAVDVNLNAGEPLKSNLVLFNDVVDDKAAIAVQMSARIAELSKSTQKETMVKVLAKYWDNIEMAVHMANTSIEIYKNSLKAVEDAFEA